MKLKKDFFVHEHAGGAVMNPTGEGGFTGVVEGNRTLGAILALLSEETTEERVVQAMLARFDAPEDAVRNDVARAVAELRAIGAIDG